MTDLDIQLRKAAQRMGLADNLGLMVMASETGREALLAGYPADVALDLALSVLRSAQDAPSLVLV